MASESSFQLLPSEDRAISPPFEPVDPQNRPIPALLDNFLCASHNLASEGQPKEMERKVTFQEEQPSVQPAAKILPVSAT